MSVSYGALKHFTSEISKLWQNPKSDVSRKQRLDRALSLYMDSQALNQYFPEIYIRKDVASYMAMKSSDWNLIEYRLDDAELDAYEAWIKSAKATPLQALNYIAEKDLKVSLSFSVDSQSWCASLTGKKDNRLNSGKTLTTWSDDPMDALVMAVFKAQTIFKDGSWATRKSANRG